MSMKNIEQHEEKARKSSFLEVFIKRPVLATVINLCIAIVGIVAWQKLIVREMPKMSFPVISIRTEYPGAGPGIVESQITIPLEESLAGLEGLDYMQSESTNGQSSVSLHFKNEVNINAAAADVRDRIQKAKNDFPPNLRDPIISKASNTERELIRIVACGDKYNLAEIADMIQRHVKGPIEAIPGVASVQVYGGGGGSDSGAFQIHALLSPEKLHAYDLTIKEIRDTIYNSSFKRPLDFVILKEKSFTITLDQAAKSLDDYANMIMKQHKSSSVRLKDVAEVKMITDDPDTKMRYNGKACVFVTLIAQQGANPMEISKNVRTKLGEIKKSTPRNLKLDIEYDRSEAIEKSISAVYSSIFEAILFVLFVMLFFLRSWRSAFIPMITIPICLLGGFFIIYAFNFTINTFTLLAMVLAIGLVVDDAIVVLENIYRYMEKGLTPLQASIAGIKEIQFAVVAMTLTLMAVYAPITLSSGMVGKYFIEFAVTLAGTVLISGLVALVLTPMLCAKTLKLEDEKHASPWQKKSRELLEKIDVSYEKWLNYAVENRKNIIMSSLGLAFCAFLTAQFYLPKILIPEVDSGYIVLNLESPSGATATYIDKYSKPIEAVLSRIPVVKNTMVSLQSRSGQNSIYLQLVDQKKRKKTAQQILSEIERRIENVQSGLSAKGHCISALASDTADNSISFVILSQKPYEEMELVAQKIKNAILTYKNAKPNSIRYSRVAPETSYTFKINEQKASQFNVRMLDIGEMLTVALRGQPPADRFEQEGKRYPMRLMVTKEFKQDPENIKRFHVRAFKSNSNDKAPPLVSLHELLEITQTQERPLAARYEGMRSYEILFDVKKGSPLRAYADIAKLLDQTLPKGYKYSPTRNLRKTIKEGNNVSLIFLLAIVFIFLIMAAQFESFIDPLMIMLSVPLALSGGVLILLFVSNASLNIFTYIALITLIGLITKHGILIIDFANKILAKKKLTRSNIVSSVKEASILRLRPILMTTAAMILGALPLALSTGSGYEIRSPIGWVIISGMTIGTLFTIFLIPCMYIIIKQRNVK